MGASDAFWGPVIWFAGPLVLLLLAMTGGAIVAAPIVGPERRRAVFGGLLKAALFIALFGTIIAAAFMAA